MRYLLDTDICIYLIKKKPHSVIQELSKLATSDIALSTVTLFELKFGVENSHQRERAASALQDFIAPIQHVLPLDVRAASGAAKIRADLKRQGTPIGPYDLLIAAIACSNDLILVSNNIREFQRIDGLKLENWIRS